MSRGDRELGFEAIARNGSEELIVVALAPEGIVVNCVCPGWVLSQSVERYLRETAARAGLGEDDLGAAHRVGVETFGSGNDLGRIGEPREIAVMVAVLCSPLAGFTVGATIPVDGGTDFF